MRIKHVGIPAAAMAIAILGAILPVRFANAGYMTHYDFLPCPNYNSTRNEPYWGGTDYCRYGVLDYTFPDNNDQIFVIGTDWSVWTRWEYSGFLGITHLSDWQDLGGTIIHASPSDYDSNYFFGTYCSDQATLDVWVVGTDGAWWYDRRNAAHGNWSGWVKPNRAPACPSPTVAALSASLDPEDAAFVQEDAALDPPELVSDPPELVSDVPEPSSSWMILTALVGLIGYRWRDRLFPSRHSA